MQDAIGDILRSIPKDKAQSDRQYSHPHKNRLLTFTQLVLAWLGVSATDALKHPNLPDYVIDALKHAELQEDLSPSLYTFSEDFLGINFREDDPARLHTLPFVKARSGVESARETLNEARTAHAWALAGVWSAWHEKLHEAFEAGDSYALIGGFCETFEIQPETFLLSLGALDLPHDLPHRELFNPHSAADHDHYHKFYLEQIDYGQIVFRLWKQELSSPT